MLALLFPFFFRESIFGYRDLSLDVFYTAGTLITYLKIKYMDKVTPQKFEGICVSTCVRSSGMFPN